jgi:hypothetical protein
MREAVLFYSFIIIFIVTAAVTLLGVTGRISIPPTQLTMLLGAFLVEVAAAVIALYKRTDFFRPQPGKLAGSLGSAIEEFDKISDEIKATLRNEALDPTHFHGFMIRRSPAGVAAYQRMKVISSQELEELPPAQKKLIRDYERAMKTLRQEWSHLKAGDANALIDPATRARNLELLRNMKDNLVGVLDFLQNNGIYLDDHYGDIRQLVSELN